MQKSLSIANNDISLSLLSDILLRAAVFIYFILLKVLSVVVDDTGIVNAAIRSDRRHENACSNGKTCK